MASNRSNTTTALRHSGRQSSNGSDDDDDASSPADADATPFRPSVGSVRRPNAYGGTHPDETAFQLMRTAFRASPHASAPRATTAQSALRDSTADSSFHESAKSAGVREVEPAAALQMFHGHDEKRNVA